MFRFGSSTEPKNRKLLSPLAFGLLVMLIVGLAVAWAAERDTRDRKRSSQPAHLRHFNLDDLTVDPEQIRSGGPPKDGIPALTNPKTKAAARAEFLRPGDRVVGVSADGHSRAYPIRVLNWHEVINDKLGDVPIAVVYCPLCDSVSVLDRRMTKDKTVEFGISGVLLNSNVLLYDRTDHALWSQAGLEAISGPHVGTSPKHLPWEILSFREWRKSHLEGTVVTLDTGHRRNYAVNPYADYFSTNRLMFPVARQDDRLPAKTRVVGVRSGDTARAYPIKALAKTADHRIRDQLDGKTIVIATDRAGQAVRIVERPEDAQVLHTFWFAWAAFHPDSDVYNPDHGSQSTPSSQPAGP